MEPEAKDIKQGQVAALSSDQPGRLDSLFCLFLLHSKYANCFTFLHIRVQCQGRLSNTVVTLFHTEHMFK